MEADTGAQEEAFDYKVEEFHKSPKSVFYGNQQSIYSDTYPAKFNDELVRMLVGLYSNEGEWVVDPMCGSGTVPLLAYQLGRYGYGQDINPKAIEICKTKNPDMNNGLCRFRHGDSKEGILFDALEEKAGLILTSPPFGIKAIVGTKKQYSKETHDITNAPDYRAWRSGLKAIMQHCYDILMPGRLMIMEIRPRSVDGHDQPMDLWIQNDALEIGFVRWSRIIETVDPWRMYSVKDRDNQMYKPYPGHADILLLKKPMHTVYSKLD